MEIKLDLTLQTKQILSQTQIQSLNILSMSITELQEFMQNEEIENPLVEYTEKKVQEELPIAYQDYDSFYRSTGERNEDGENNLHELQTGAMSLPDLVLSQLDYHNITPVQQTIIDFCIQSLDQNGFLTISPEEIADILDVSKELVDITLNLLLSLEPSGIFSSGLEECLILQIQHHDDKDLLKQVIQNHLPDVATGRISTISRALKIPTSKVRKLIQCIQKLNPRPLNGFGTEHSAYIIPDIILLYVNEQWIIKMNDQWTGSLRVNQYYADLLEHTQDEELKIYFKEKLQRARLVINAIEQRRNTILQIVKAILDRQAGYLLGIGPLKPMTLEEIAHECQLHKSTISRAIHEKYILTPLTCICIRDLFTRAVSDSKTTEGGINRETIKSYIKHFTDSEDKKNPYSDDQLVQLLKTHGISISRRTVAKYRIELNIPGMHQRKSL